MLESEKDISMETSVKAIEDALLVHGQGHGHLRTTSAHRCRTGQGGDPFLLSPAWRAFTRALPADCDLYLVQSLSRNTPSSEV